MEEHVIDTESFVEQSLEVSMERNDEWEERWPGVLRDLLVFQFKLVVDGLKDLGLAQVALGAALLDFLRRDGSPGRRFYAIVRLSDRFDRWLDLHEPLIRVPEDAPEYGIPSETSVDDVIEGVERSARVVAEHSARGVRRVRSEMTSRRDFREVRHPGFRQAGDTA